MQTIEDVRAVRFNERAIAAQIDGTLEQVLPTLDLELLHIAGYPCPEETYLEIITATVGFWDYTLHSRNVAVISLVHKPQSFMNLVSIYDKCIDGKIRIQLTSHLLTKAETGVDFEALVARFDQASWGYRVAHRQLTYLQAVIS